MLVHSRKKRTFKRLTVFLIFTYLILICMKKQLLKAAGTRRSFTLTLQRLVWVAFFSVATWAVSAQSRTITGTVVDAENNPVAGASIVLDGTSRGTSALGDGTFSLANVPASGTLTVSMLGFTDQSVPLTASNYYSVTLSEDTRFLDEVVVVGYGVMRKSDVTGAMSSVGAEQLQERPVANPFQALQGRAAGVDITNSARPGELGRIRIRGERSISGGNDPLYVVDGIPLQGDTNISTINTYDIKSIDILKDASATAIYGSRGANGVVLVTTNRGEAGRFSINYNGSLSIDKIVDSAERMNSADYIDYVRWAIYYVDPLNNPRGDQPTIENDSKFLASDPFAWDNVVQGWSNGKEGGTWNGANVPTTDWIGMITRTGITHNHQISASGGTDRMTSRASFGYYNQKGTSYGQEMERYTLNTATILKPKSWFELSASINATWAIQEYGQDGTGASSSSGPGSVFASAARMLPYAVPFEPDGDRIKAPGGRDALRNPVEEWKHSRNRRETFNAFASVSAKVYLPIEGLTYEFRTGPSFRQRRNGIFVSPLSAVRQDDFNVVRLEQNRQFSWNIENQVNYIRTFGKHNINVTLLQSAEKFQRVEDYIRGDHLTYEPALWNNMNLTQVSSRSVNSDLVERQLTSYMIRPQYTFNDKYILTGTVRWDGSSVLAPGYKWGTFYSIAGAWRLEQEEFIKNISWIQQLKLRLGYGEAGQQGGISPYSALANITQGIFPYGTDYEYFYNINSPRSNVRYADPTLGWETTRTLNVGLDFSMFRSRVSGSIDYYHSITSDLILNAMIMPQTGYLETTSNVGKTQNNGVELTLNTINVRAGNFLWESNLNLAWQKNKILELSNGKVDEINDKRFIGEPIGVHYDYKSAGVWRPEDEAEMQAFNDNGHKFVLGQARVVDVDNDGRITADDRVVIGRTQPAWTGGFNNTFSYKGIELNIMMYGRLGYWDDGGIPSLAGVQNSRKVDYYTEVNTNAEFHRPFLVDNGADNDPYHGSQQYYKASFVNVRNIMLGYVFPRPLVQKWGMQNLRVYAQVENPFAVYQSVKWKNMDVDSEFYNRSFVFGINIGF